MRNILVSVVIWLVLAGGLPVPVSRPIQFFTLSVTGQTPSPPAPLPQGGEGRSKLDSFLTEAEGVNSGESLPSPPWGRGAGGEGGWSTVTWDRTLGASPQVAQTHENQRATARHGMQLLMDGDMDGAAQTFRQIEQTDPESALGYVLEADVYWWKIYLTEANLVDPDVFEALSEAVTPYDAEFQRLNGLAIEKAESQIHARQDDAQSRLYEGLAYALQARLEALRDHALATARNGKKMRNLSMAALKLDPALYDANLGVGIYNYFEATLPTYVKMLRFLILLPGGNRELGLQQLQTAAEKGEITSGEARFHLSKNLSRNNERQYARSLELLQGMQRDYPHNPLWKLLVASLEIRMGQIQQGEALYREVIKETENSPSEVWKPLHGQAQKALDRRHGIG